MPGLHRLGELAEVLVRDLAEQHRVKGVVAVAGACPLLVPPLDCLMDRLAALDRGEIDRCRGAAVQGREADPRGRLGQCRLGDAGHRHWPVAMHMRVDATGDHDLPRRVDGPSGANAGKAAWRADRGNMLAGNADIGRLGARGEGGEAARDDDVQHVNLLPIHART